MSVEESSHINDRIDIADLEKQALELQKTFETMKEQFEKILMLTTVEIVREDESNTSKITKLMNQITITPSCNRLESHNPGKVSRLTKMMGTLNIRRHHPYSRRCL
ncbi:hypothetical protein GWI33_014520 [Rhynchophorus ferrugineus]|uniref:Uncharacterized protein n=1 Tax=Rhynchophorus ferrugineus TaxID=354439 RepID=A0A834I780_RHYFE|nr:hypothetical protein GWI33_014520 [Rhynchophorus ferrugineus]